MLSCHPALARLVAAAGIALASAGPAGAVALAGGVMGASFPTGSGLCSKSVQTPLTTPQDSFSATLNAPCVAGFVSGDLRADAATRSVGLRLQASGDGVTSGQVGLIDTWLLQAPPGTPVGIYGIPVRLSFDGSVSAGAEARFGRYLDYSLTIRDIYSGLPTSLAQANGSVSATGAASFGFDAVVDFVYRGPGSGLPTTAEVTLSLPAPQLKRGTIDFYDSASISLALPAGWSATTSSGVPLVFAPVPEPSTVALWLLGGGVVSGVRTGRRRSRARDDRMPRLRSRARDDR